MDVFGFDALIGDFRLSDYGLMLATFSFNDSFDIGMSMETKEVYLPKNPVPVYLESDYKSKLTPTITIIQNEKISNKIYFTTDEIRDILRRLTGYQGYKRFYIYGYDFMEDLYFNIRFTDVEFEKSAGNIVGIRLNAECDSPFAWIDEEYNFDIQNSNQDIVVRNDSDDIYNYLLPKITITFNSTGSNFTITNTTDNNRQTKINSFSANETIIIDSNIGKVSSSLARSLANEFNYIFPKLISGDNTLKISHTSNISISMKLPRKVGMI